jgi:hypothetical protein
VDIRIIFLGVNLAKEVAGYLGLIETLKAKIDRLAGSEFDAGIRSLNQAVNSTSERLTLLREARSRFNKAASLEDNERLALCYLGLALCHKNLGDEANFLDALNSIARIELTGKAKAVAGSVAEDMVMGGLWKLAIGLPPGASLSMINYESRKARLEELKDSVQSYVNQFS